MRKRVLNAGAGRVALKKFKGWEEVRLDMNPATQPDVLGNIVEMPLPSFSFDAVYSVHTLEHVTRRESIAAMGEFYRVLKRGGFLLLHVPSVELAMWTIIRDGMDYPVYELNGHPFTPHDLLYGAMQMDEFTVHRTGFTLESLREIMRLAGFTNPKLLRRFSDNVGIGFKL